MNHQSAIAKRSIALLELSSVRRDPNYEENMEEPGDATAETAIRVRTRRKSGTILLTEELGHLSRHFEKTKPGCWWTTVFLLVVRLLSTSLAALLRDQGSQVITHLDLFLCGRAPSCLVVLTVFCFPAGSNVKPRRAGMC